MISEVPRIRLHTSRGPNKQVKIKHPTMQTLGRFAIIGGTVLVALVNVILFRDVESLEQSEKINLYGTIYLYALVIPLVSILGVILANYLRQKKINILNLQGLEFNEERGIEKGNQSVYGFLLQRHRREGGGERRR